MSPEIQYQGSRFYRCALQVNPFSYAQYQGEPPLEEADYNKQILRQCQDNHIEVVGLADHGKVEHSEALRNLLQNNGITVFPGFEITSSEKIHMVCLYPEDDSLADLNQHLGQLMGENSTRLAQEPTHPSSLSCEQIATKVIHEQDGFWYAAHITGNNGLLKLDGSGGSHVQLWKKEELVRAGQIPGPIEDLRVNHNNERKYREIIENKNPDYKREKPVVVINAKDIKKPETLSDQSASCLVKMTKPNFPAFKQAFYDPESRIRLNHQIPKNPYSVIESIQWQGAGFFSETHLGISKNLNAIIGGRGTGKSTLIEGIRYVLDLPTGGQDNRALEALRKNNLGDSKITLNVTSKAQSGQRYTISRRYGEQTIVKNEQGQPSHLNIRDILPDVVLLGQNEILEIEKDDSAKLALINDFLPDSHEFDETLREIKRRLADNRKKWIKADEDFDRLNAVVQQEPKLKEQVAQFKKLGIEKKLKNVDLLEKETSIQTDIRRQIELVEKWLKDYEEVFELEFLQDARINPLPNKVILSEIRGILEVLKDQLDGLIQQAKRHVEDALNKQDALQTNWNNNADKIKDELQKAIAGLPEQAGKTGKTLGREYTSIVKALTLMDKQKNEHKRQEKLIEAIKKERDILLEKYRDTAFNRFADLKKAAERLNQKELKGKVRIRVERCGNPGSLKDFLLKIEGIGEGRIRWLDQTVDVDLLAWSKWIEGKNSQAFMDKYASAGLQHSTVDKLLNLNLQKRLELEEIELKDRVEIELNVARDGEENYKPLNDLSTGQKCTAILNLLLSGRDDPLIIDQPEDHLDNAFIADRIVHDLRNLKTKRQFIFATHNANIPVFGDAELIAVLYSDKDGGKVIEIGAIDKLEVRERAAEILEGGKAAFEMRRRKYGY